MFLKLLSWFISLIPKRSQNIKVPIIYYYKLNLNNRYYSPESLSESLLNNKIESLGFIPGQIGYPEDINPSISKMSHLFTKFYIQNNILWGEGKTLKTKEGQKLNWLILTNQVVFRPRLIGSGLETGETKIKDVLAIDAISKKEDSFILQVNQDGLQKISKY